MRRLSSDGVGTGGDGDGGGGGGGELPGAMILYSSIGVSMFFSFGDPMES
jgi:hypothetical protein